MFGYITFNEPELRMREIALYRSYYCGLCEDLLETYGRAGQLTLNYDTTFLGFLLTSLYEPDRERRTQTVCTVHPFQKHPMRRNVYTQYAADMTILLSRYSMRDDWEDEKKIRGLALSGLLGPAFRKAQARHPHKADVIGKCLRRLHELEKNPASAGPDETGSCFGDLMAEIFAFSDDVWEEPLRRTGFYLGKFIYLLDAYEDLEKDEKHGSFNPLLAVRARMLAEEPILSRVQAEAPVPPRPDENLSQAAERACSREPAGVRECGQDQPQNLFSFDNYVRELLTMLMASCTRAFEALPIVENIDILRNILYAGVWTHFDRIYAQRTCVSSGENPQSADEPEETVRRGD